MTEFRFLPADHGRIKELEKDVEELEKKIDAFHKNWIDSKKEVYQLQRENAELKAKVRYYERLNDHESD